MKKTRPIRKLLAANRSEIAIRIFRAANELGLRTVAIYSQEDRLALHRFKADEAYQVGAGKGPVEAYLDIPGIIAIAKAHDVDAIHPGYGFLSENPALARACAKAGIAFVGPTPELLELLGDKTAARRLAAEAGVSVLPGTENPLATPEEAQKIAEEIGYPVIVKAAMGGGGRGWKRRKAKPGRRSAMLRFSWKSICRAPATLKYRFWPTNTATCCICTSATARCSGDIRRSSK
jgi:pyruvate carboxylase